MKKIIYLISLSLLLFTFHSTPISAKTNTTLLVHIENANDLYLLDISNDEMKVNIISNNTYLPVTCLNNEPSTLKSVNFKAASTSLVHTLENFLSIKIDKYVYIHMEKLLLDLNLKNNTYDSLSNLTDTAKNIKNNIKLKTIINYQNYINTDLEIEDLYNLYQLFKKTDIKITYYTLPYLIYKDLYIPLERTFYLKD